MSESDVAQKNWNDMTSPSVDYVWPLQPVTSTRRWVVNVRIKVQPTRRGTHSSLPSQHPRSMASKLSVPITLRGDTQSNEKTSHIIPAFIFGQFEDLTSRLSRSDQ